MAETLRDWLPDVIQTCKPWISSKDIAPGKRWNTEIAKQLDQTNFGIVCLTPENLNDPWIHFEAGALAKRIDTARVCPYLLGLKTTDIEGPLESFQAKRADFKEDTKDIVQEIYSVSGEHDLTPERLNRAFDSNWNRLDTNLKEILERTQTVNKPSREPEDMIGEVLEVVRDQSKLLIKINEILINSSYYPITRVNERLINILVDNAKSLPLEQLFNEKFLSKSTTYNSFEELIKDVEKAIGKRIVTQEDLIASEKWPEPIKSRTRFPDATTMLRVSMSEWVQDVIK